MGWTYLLKCAKDSPGFIRRSDVFESSSLWAFFCFFRVGPSRPVSSELRFCLARHSCWIFAALRTRDTLLGISSLLRDVFSGAEFVPLEIGLVGERLCLEEVSYIRI